MSYDSARKLARTRLGDPPTPGSVCPNPSHEPRGEIVWTFVLSYTGTHPTGYLYPQQLSCPYDDTGRDYVWECESCNSRRRQPRRARRRALLFNSPEGRVLRANQRAGVRALTKRRRVPPGRVVIE